MKKLFSIIAVALLIASCGGGGGGDGSDSWNSGSESNPTVSTINAAGSTVTTQAPNVPMIVKAAGLLQNGVYNIQVLDPNGSAVFTQNLTLITDGSGNLQPSIIAYLGLDTQTQANASVNMSGFKQVFGNYKAVVPGQYTVYICKSTEETCDASTASATTALTVDGSAAYVYSANAAGDGVNSFENTKGDVYAVVTGGAAATNIDLYAIANSFQDLTDGDPIPSAVAGPTVCTTDASGDCAATLLWTDATATLTDQAALYDIIADVNQNGVWDEGVDLIDSAGYVAGFAVQDPTSAITPNLTSSFGQLKAVSGGADRVVNISAARDGSAYCTHNDYFSGFDVYGYLNPHVQTLDPHNIAWKFIILHDDNLADGDTLTPIQSFGYNHTVDPLQWGCTNESCILLWPHATHVPGCYDVVMDVNQNGIYDTGVDFVDGSNGVCGFVIPGADGAPTVTVDSITDGNGDAVTSGGSTTSSTAMFDITVGLGAGSSIDSCTMRWASGSSSSVTTIVIDDITTGGSKQTQPISLFGGTNTILITCLDNSNVAGAATVTIDSSNTATQNIHFQASLNWQGPASNPGQTSGSDMDLHLIEPGGAYDTNTDCYYANCKEDIGGNTTVGAFLNVDCIGQCNGPENIWIPNSNALKNGMYNVCVDPFDGQGTNLKVDIFNSAGALIDTVTRSTLTEDTGGGNADVWNVGAFSCSGTLCTWSKIDALNTAPCN